MSSGCEACYAERQAYRFSTKPGSPYEGLVRLGKKGPVWTGKVRLVATALAEPLSWKRPQRVFVNSMSDLFHEGLSNEGIAAVFGVMAASPRHTFQVLTKRAKRMREWFEWVDDQVYRERHVVSSRLMWLAICAENLGHALPITHEWQVRSGRDEWPLPNVHLGVSAEDQVRADERVPELLRTPASIRFVSYEPALEPVDFTPWLDPIAPTGVDDHFECVDGLDWVIIGGESGPRARPFDVAWARSVVEQCERSNTACFVKQMGAKPYAMTFPSGIAYRRELRLKDRKGGDMAEWPADLRVREFPKAVAL